MSVAATLVHTLRKRLSKPGGYELFDIHLQQRIALSPSLMRFVFTGTDVGLMQTLAPDQRVKLFFPSNDGTLPCLPKSGDWQAARRALSADKIPPMRTYTVRDLRPDAHELDIDFVLHGETGPASRWAVHSQPGDRLQIVAPQAAYRGDPGGYEWQPPQGGRQ
ncbi:siderophore-interacting protein, partial [Pseudomonas sp.]|uniref:siderophore-interacting protein n=1 Tax=Pseudomonas sp. TaxID=306 RepID=UPI0023525E08